jgi:hypothetical protein
MENHAQHNFMRLSKAGLVISGLYIACITAALIANQHGNDPEGKIVGLLVLGLPWDLVWIFLKYEGGWSAVAVIIALNAATVYLIVAWISNLVAQRKRKLRYPADVPKD